MPAEHPRRPFGHKRHLSRNWRAESPAGPERSKQPKRGRLWLTDGSCVRRRPAYRHHVWAYAFLTARTQDGRVLKILIERWRREYNPVRPHSALGYRPPRLRRPSAPRP